MNELISPQELQNGCKKIKAEEIKDFDHFISIKDEPSAADEDYLEELENGITVIIKEEVVDHNDNSIDDVVFLEESEIGNQVIIKEEVEDVEIKLKDLHDSVGIKDETELKTETKQFECRVCNLKFLNEWTLQEHSRIHNSNRCSYQDSFSKFLKGHIDEKSFACEKCSYTTSCAELFKGHLRMHTTIFVPLNCDICGYKLPQESLKHQVLSHKSKEPFAYKISAITCSRTANCRDCVKIRYPDSRPYACELCNYRGSTSAHLNRHLKIHTHGEQSGIKCDTFSLTN